MITKNNFFFNFKYINKLSTKLYILPENERLVQECIKRFDKMANKNKKKQSFYFFIFIILVATPVPLDLKVPPGISIISAFI